MILDFIFKLNSFINKRIQVKAEELRGPCGIMRALRSKAIYGRGFKPRRRSSVGECGVLPFSALPCQIRGWGAMLSEYQAEYPDVNKLLHECHIDLSQLTI